MNYPHLDSGMGGKAVGGRTLQRRRKSSRDRRRAKGKLREDSRDAAKCGCTNSRPDAWCEMETVGVELKSATMIHRSCRFNLEISFNNNELQFETIFIESLHIENVSWREFFEIRKLIQKSFSEQHICISRLNWQRGTQNFCTWRQRYWRCWGPHSGKFRNSSRWAETSTNIEIFSKYRYARMKRLWLSGRVDKRSDPLLSSGFIKGWERGGRWQRSEARNPARICRFMNWGRNV